MIHPDYLKSINIKYREKFNDYRIDYFYAPAIEFRRPRINLTDKTLIEGRIYYKTEKSPYKDEKFFKTSEKLFRWIRSNFKNTKINTKLTTQRVYEWKSNEKGKLLTSYGVEL